MKQYAQDRESRWEAQGASKNSPGFKPVALPALAAAVEAAKMNAPQPKQRELPPILRKDAALD